MISPARGRSRRLCPHVARRWPRCVIWGSRHRRLLRDSSHHAGRSKPGSRACSRARTPMTTIHRGALTAVAAILLTTGLAVAGVRLGEPAGGPQEKGTADSPQARPRRRPEQTRIIGLVIDEAGTPRRRRRSSGSSAGTNFATTSGPDGDFTVIVDEPALNHHMLHASAGEGAKQGLFIFPETIYNPEKTVKVVLRSARSVTVRVTDKLGAAVPNATIVVPAEISTSRGRVDFTLLSSQTDVQGVAHLRVPVDAKCLTSSRSSPASASTIMKPIALSPGCAKGRSCRSRTTITLVLAGARTAKIRVIDSAGKPIPDVELLPVGINIRGKIDSVSSGNAPVFWVNTDAHGIVTFDFLPERLEQASFSLAFGQFLPESIPLTLSSAELKLTGTFACSATYRFQAA